MSKRRAANAAHHTLATAQPKQQTNNERALNVGTDAVAHNIPCTAQLKQRNARVYANEPTMSSDGVAVEILASGFADVSLGDESHESDDDAAESREVGEDDVASDNAGADDAAREQEHQEEGSATPSASAAVAASSSADDERALQVVTEGAYLTKYGRRGKPHARYVRVSLAEKVVLFSETPTSSPVKALRLTHIVALRTGRRTKVMTRREHRHVDEKVCLSLVTLERSLDLSCSSDVERTVWLRGVLCAYERALNKPFKDLRMAGAGW
jgi:hypothetical protein